MFPAAIRGADTAQTGHKEIEIIECERRWFDCRLYMMRNDLGRASRQGNAQVPIDPGDAFLLNCWIKNVTPVTSGWIRFLPVVLGFRVIRAVSRVLPCDLF